MVILAIFIPYNQYNCTQILDITIGIIADMDTASKSYTDPEIWQVYYKKGYISYNPVKIHWL